MDSDKEIVQPIFRMGKIKSKYHILDLLSHAGYSNELAALMFYCSKSFRMLITRNPRLFLRFIKEKLISVVSNFADLFQSCIITNSRLSFHFFMSETKVQSLAQFKDRLPPKIKMDCEAFYLNETDFTDMDRLNKALTTLYNVFKPRYIYVKFRENPDQSEIQCFASLRINHLKVSTLPTERTLNNPTLIKILGNTHIFVLPMGTYFNKHQHADLRKVKPADVISYA